MTKAVMMSIQPKWVEKILNGEKTIEVRKTAPKFERQCSDIADKVGGELGKMYREPIKVYIYCTKGGRPLVYHDADKKYIMSKWSGNSEMMLRDTLNGKVVAEFTCDRIDFISSDCHTMMELEETMCKSCIPITTFTTYLWKDDKGVYLWHISNLKIYDKPRELGEFHKIGQGGDVVDVGMKRPFQSWGYVEEIGND